MKTLIIGAGSVGLVFAGKLSAASIPYQLLARSNYHSLSRGFKLTTMKGGEIGAEATICPPAGGVLTLEEAEKLAAENPWDNIIVATQTTQLLSLAPTLSSLMKPDGVCFCLQNGYDFERPLAETLLPSQTLISGTIWVIKQLH